MILAALLITAPCIVLDPGHGGSRDDGTTVLDLKEKNLALSITRRTKDQLARALPQYQILQTRDEDRDMPLLERARFANKSGCKVLVSIHVNGSIEPSMHGLESYSLDTGKQRLVRRLRDLLGGDADEASIIVRDMRARHYAEQGAELARIVHEKVFGSAQAVAPEIRSNGIRRDLLLLLLAAEMPGVLVETGYLSNQRERANLIDTRYQNAVAAGITEGVKRFVELHP